MSLGCRGRWGFAMMSVTIADILMHNFLRQPIRGTFDLVELFLVLAVFLGIPEVFRSEGNITVDVIDHFVTASTKRVLHAAALILTFGFLLLLGYAMISPAMDTVMFLSTSRKPAFQHGFFGYRFTRYRSRDYCDRRQGCLVDGRAAWGRTGVMTVQTIGLISISGMLVLILLRVPVAIAMGLAGFLATRRSTAGKRHS